MDKTSLELWANAHRIARDELSPKYAEARRLLHERLGDASIKGLQAETAELEGNARLLEKIMSHFPHAMNTSRTWRGGREFSAIFYTDTPDAYAAIKASVWWAGGGPYSYSSGALPYYPIGRRLVVETAGSMYPQWELMLWCAADNTDQADPVRRLRVVKAYNHELEAFEQHARQTLTSIDPKELEKAYEHKSKAYEIHQPWNSQQGLVLHQADPNAVFGRNSSLPRKFKGSVQDPAALTELYKKMRGELRVLTTSSNYPILDIGLNDAQLAEFNVLDTISTKLAPTFNVLDEVGQTILSYAAHSDAARSEHGSA